ncbi:MAG: DUF4832 domain-containing protein [Spirochaetales bacterium]|nr:DUF4832 domain-containing protein [Spirochaetales bacterium]
MKAAVIMIGVTLVFWFSCQSIAEVSIILEEGGLIKLAKSYNPATRYQPRINPLKGFVPFQNPPSDFPCSMEFFAFPLSKIIFSENNLDFDYFEKQLSDIASRGNQAICRPYLDYPGEATGIPRYLIDKGLKVQKYSDHGGGLSPDYSDPRLITALEYFIQQWARQYDGDSRLGFITLGLLGFWGEWHTWPHDQWFAPQKTQEQIIKTYDGSFKKTALLMRLPHPHAEFTRIGFHDDSFAFSTLPPTDWHFWPQLKAARLEDAWKTRPIGGEVRPEIQQILWKSPNRVPEDYHLAVRTTHASWLINQAPFEPDFKAWPSVAKNRAIAGSLALGYDFFVSQISLVEKKPMDFQLDVEIQNLGVAPFYYQWPLEYRLGNVNKDLAQGFLEWDMGQCLPGNKDKVTACFTIEKTLSRGDYTIWLRIRNPMAKGKALMFSNKESQKQKQGWVPLCAFRVKGN